jgi:hypothetical protein
MPTGYTDKIKDDITFEEFAMGCARATGACITMKDDSSGEEVPQKFEPSVYHLEEMHRYQEKLNELNNLTPEEAEERAVAEHEKSFADSVNYQSNREQLKLKYDTMLEKVNAWRPPTDEHTGLKDFMIQQITDSTKFDCASYYGSEVPQLISGPEWLADRIDSIADSIDYHAKQHTGEIKRVAVRNLWLSQLRGSLKLKVEL